jgi:hypothetical protein
LAVLIARFFVVKPKTFSELRTIVRLQRRENQIVQVLFFFSSVLVFLTNFENTQNKFLDFIPRNFGFTDCPRQRFFIKAFRNQVFFQSLIFAAFHVNLVLNFVKIVDLIANQKRILKKLFLVNHANFLSIEAEIPDNLINFVKIKYCDAKWRVFGLLIFEILEFLFKIKKKI